MKLILQGYSGKMGKVVYEYLKKRGHEFCGLFDENNVVIEDAFETCDAIIDFSNIEAAKKIFDLAIIYKKPIIIGTTGFNESQIKIMEQMASDAEISAYLVFNFLPSIKILKDTIESLDDSHDKVYLSETHHESKKDSPSGTAKYLLENLSNNKVQILSKRVPYLVYEHHIEMINEFESIEIIHKCYNKIGYAKGVEKALQTLGTFVGLRRHI